MQLDLGSDSEQDYLLQAEVHLLRNLPIRRSDTGATSRLSPLEKNPESKIFPIFNFFENWCQDENRHGDFFDALMKSQPDTVRGPIAKLWCRFFLLAVFATMYVRDVARKELQALGLDAYLRQDGNREN